MATENEQMLAAIKEMQQALVALKANPANTLPKAVFGGFQERVPAGAAGWPEKQLQQIAEVYGSPAAVNLWCRKGGNGRLRASGMGPALLRLAGMSGNRDALALVQAQGYDFNNYGPEQLEKEHGFMSYAKALSYGKVNDDGQVRKAALAEGAGATGGYIIPPQFMNELLTIAAEDGFIEQRAKVIPMNSRTAQWPTLDITTAQATGVSPYFGGVIATWQPEAVTISETEPAFRLDTWTAWDLVLYTVSSNQLLADNGIGLDALLTQLFGAAITWYKEFAYLQGTGTGASMPLGILNAGATYVQSRAVTNHFRLADAAAMMSHLQVRSWDDACWVMHQSVLPDLIQMNDGSVGPAAAANAAVPAGNRLVWMNPTMTGDRGPAAMKLPNAFLNGLPLFFTEKLPKLGTKGDVMLVDWSRYVIGMRMDMQIDVSPHYLFRNNQLAWRVIARCDGKPWLNNTITDAQGFSVSPMVTLAA